MMKKNNDTLDFSNERSNWSTVSPSLSPPEELTQPSKQDVYSDPPETAGRVWGQDDVVQGGSSYCQGCDVTVMTSSSWTVYRQRAEITELSGGRDGRTSLSL